MALRIDVLSTMVTADAMKKALNEGLETVSYTHLTLPTNREV